MSPKVKNGIAFGVAAVVVLGIVSYFAIAAMPHKSLQVSSDPTTAASAGAKLDHIKSVEYGPDQHHQTETASETFTDAELTWLANNRVQRSKLPFDGIVVHTNDDGTLESQFNDHMGPIIFPVYVRIRATVQSNQVNIEILESKFGQWDVPAGVSNGLRQALDQIYGLSREHTKNFDDITVSITQGKLAVTVVGSPHPDRPHPGYS
jgi:hypothetical protein